MRNRGWGSAGELLVDRDRHDLAAFGTEVAAAQLLDDRDRVRTVLDEVAEEEIAGEHAEQPVAELLVVDEELLFGVVEVAREREIDVAQTVFDLVAPPERQV